MESWASACGVSAPVLADVVVARPPPWEIVFLVLQIPPTAARGLLCLEFQAKVLGPGLGSCALLGDQADPWLRSLLWVLFPPAPVVGLPWRGQDHWAYRRSDQDHSLWSVGFPDVLAVELPRQGRDYQDLRESFLVQAPTWG